MLWSLAKSSGHWCFDAVTSEERHGDPRTRGDPTVFLTRPISAALMVVAVGALVLAVLPAIRRRREVVFQEEL
jgi:MYXO-CTERM domain-containing protein